MEEKRCLLCNKSYDYKYKMFGRGCLDNIYGVLNFHKPPKFVWNKESYLCTKIAWKNHKYFLSKTKDILSTTLNNLGVASSKYGVIKVYDVEIKFETKEGEF